MNASLLFGHPNNTNVGYYQIVVRSVLHEKRRQCLPYNAGRLTSKTATGTIVWRGQVSILHISWSTAHVADSFAASYFHRSFDFSFLKTNTCLKNDSWRETDVSVT